MPSKADVLCGDSARTDSTRRQCDQVDVRNKCGGDKKENLHKLMDVEGTGPGILCWKSKHAVCWSRAGESKLPSDGEPSSECEL